MNRLNDDIEMLLAACLPGERTDAQRAELDRIVSQDEQARRTAAAYDKLTALLKGWRPLPAGIDWQAATVAAVQRIRSGELAPTDSNDAGVEQLIPHWSSPVPQVDYRALKTRISSAVRREAHTVKTGSIGRIRSRRRVLAWIGRVGAPLTVAAALAIAIWWPHDVAGPTTGSSGNAGGTIARGPDREATPDRKRTVLVSLDTPDSTGSVTVKLDEAKRDSQALGEPEGWAGIAGDRDDWDARDVSVDPFLY